MFTSEKKRELNKLKRIAETMKDKYHVKVTTDMIKKVKNNRDIDVYVAVVGSNAMLIYSRGRVQCINI